VSAQIELERRVAVTIRTVLARRRSMALPVDDGIRTMAALGRWSSRALPALESLTPTPLAPVLDALRFSPSLARSLMASGAVQAETLGALLQSSAEQRERAAALGALFNFGICVFDTVCDRFPEQRAMLRNALGTGALRALVEGGSLEPAPSSRPVAFLLALIRRYFEMAREMASSPSAWFELVRTIMRMFTAEWTVTDVGRAASSPTMSVFRRLRSKSVDPMWTLALGSLLQRPDIVRYGSLRRTVSPAGEVIWLIDDLADLLDDWRAGAWSRPWWLWVRSSRAAHDTDEATALRGVLESGVVEAEAQRIANRMDRLRWSLPASGRHFYAKLALSLSSWVERLPS
jgi:hypothetical protein